MNCFLCSGPDPTLFVEIFFLKNKIKIRIDIYRAPPDFQYKEAVSPVVDVHALQTSDHGFDSADH